MNTVCEFRLGPALSLSAVVVGVALAAVLSAANVCLGLFAGLTVSAPIPAAVLGLAILRVFADANLLEDSVAPPARRAPPA